MKPGRAEPDGPARAAKVPGGDDIWEEVGKPDIQRWIVWLLDRYSSAYASNQYRALQQFFKWLAAEEQIPDPMAGLKPPRGPDKPVPVFTAGDLPRLKRACAGRGFAERRDTALIAVFNATGIRLSELAGIRYDAGDPWRSDVDLWHREITVRGKGRKTRVVKISFDAARSLDRYLRVRARHAQAYRPQLWLGVNNRGPMTASGIYQVTVRRGRQCGIEVFPHRFRHHFSHTWPDRGGAEGDLMELSGWRIQGVVATRWFLLFEELSELFARGVPAEAFSGAVVEFVFDGLELGGGVLAEVGALGEVFAEQAVGVLVAAALPGCVGAGEAGVDAGVGGDAGVPGHFAAVVPGQGAGEPAGQGGHPGRDRGGDGVGSVAVGQAEQGEVAGHPLDDGADGGVGRRGAHDEVAFVVAGDQAALGVGRALPDRDRADDLPAGLAAAAALADVPAGPQARLELAAQLPAGVEADRLVDRLVADVHGRVAGVHDLQSPAGLLGGVPAVQQVLHRGPQHRVPRQPGALGPPLPLPREPFRPLGLVLPGPRVSVTGQLPRHRRRRPAQAVSMAKFLSPLVAR
jgi:integrase